MMRFLRFTKTFIAAAALGAACTFATPVAASADRYERHVWLPFPPPPPFFFRPSYWDHRNERYERNERWRDRHERHDRYERRHDRHERHERWRR
jgi:hypothetical protein